MSGSKNNRNDVRIIKTLVKSGDIAFALKTLRVARKVLKRDC